MASFLVRHLNGAPAPSREDASEAEATGEPSDATGTLRRAPALIVLTLLASAINYASNIVFGRLLDPAGFGELTALLALGTIIVVPTAAAQTVVAERVAVYAARGSMNDVRYLVRFAIAHAGLLAVAVGFLFMLALPLTVSALDLGQPGPAIALGAFIMLAFLQPVALAVLQGLDRFTAFGTMQVSIALSRMVFGVPWILLGGGAGGAIGGQAVGVAVVLIGTTWLLRDLLLGSGTGAATRGLKRLPDRRAVFASGAFVAFAVVSNLDLLLAKIFLDPDDVGVYAAITTVGKIVLFLPAAIAVALVPNAARAHSTEGDSQRVLRVAARLVAVTAIAAAIPAALVPGKVIGTMFGASYAEAADGILPIVIAGAALSLLYLLVVYSVTVEDRRWPVLLGLGVAIQVIGVALFHDSPVQVAQVQAVATVAVLAVNEIGFHSIMRTRASRR